MSILFLIPAPPIRLRDAPARRFPANTKDQRFAATTHDPATDYRLLAVTCAPYGRGASVGRGRGDGVARSPGIAGGVPVSVGVGVAVGVGGLTTS